MVELKKLNDIQRHKKRRLNMLMEMKGFEWDSIFFSDEISFWLGSGPSYAWQKPGERLQNYMYGGLSILI